MKERMSRGHKKRHGFKVDSLLFTNKNRLEEEKEKGPGNYMSLMFLGFYNKSLPEEQFAEVEIVISKISHMKRKDRFNAMQERVSSLADWVTQFIQPISFYLFFSYLIAFVKRMPDEHAIDFSIFFLFLSSFHFHCAFVVANRFPLPGVSNYS